jgi:hypothetical protein
MIANNEKQNLCQVSKEGSKRKGTVVRETERERERERDRERETQRERDREVGQRN